MYSNYQDVHGLIHLREYPPLDESENTPLFNSASELLMTLNGTPRTNMIKADYSVFRRNGDFNTYPNSDDCRFSHDNMTGMYIAKVLGNHNQELPIIKWESWARDKNEKERDYWLHPRDIIFYASLQDKKWANFLLPLLILISIPSFFGTETSGKCLWFYRYNTLKLSGGFIKKSVGTIGLWLGSLISKREFGPHPFIGIFNRYFKDPNHPINQEIKKYYKGA